jgi:hypothetical protein
VSKRLVLRQTGGFSRGKSGGNVMEKMNVGEILVFPRMIVIFLETGGRMPDMLAMRMKFPDGTERDFKVKMIAV